MDLGTEMVEGNPRMKIKRDNERAIEYRSRLFRLQSRVSSKGEGYDRKLELT